MQALPGDALAKLFSDLVDELKARVLPELSGEDPG